MIDLKLSAQDAEFAASIDNALFGIDEFFSKIVAFFRRGLLTKH